MLLTWKNDTRHDPQWYGHWYTDSSSLVVSIDEPPGNKRKINQSQLHCKSVTNNGNRLCRGSRGLFSARDSQSVQAGIWQLDHCNKICSVSEIRAIPGHLITNAMQPFTNLFHKCFPESNDWLLLMDGKD